jgi:hypothetical protein
MQSSIIFDTSSQNCGWLSRLWNIAFILSTLSRSHYSCTTGTFSYRDTERVEAEDDWRRGGEDALHSGPQRGDVMGGGVPSSGFTFRESEHVDIDDDWVQGNRADAQLQLRGPDGTDSPMDEGARAAAHSFRAMDRVAYDDDWATGGASELHLRGPNLDDGGGGGSARMHDYRSLAKVDRDDDWQGVSANEQLELRPPTMFDDSGQRTLNAFRDLGKIDYEEDWQRTSREDRKVCVCVCVCVACVRACVCVCVCGVCEICTQCALLEHRTSCVGTSFLCVRLLTTIDRRDINAAPGVIWTRS